MSEFEQWIGPNKGGLTVAEARSGTEYIVEKAFSRKEEIIKWTVMPNGGPFKEKICYVDGPGTIDMVKEYLAGK